MAQPEMTRPRRRPRPTFRTVEVRRVERLTPNMMRVCLGGDELKGFATKGPAEHIKIFFPEPGEERPILPVWGPKGPELPPGGKRPTSRTYTPRRWDPDANELEVDFAIHSGGVGARWIQSAQVGDIVVVAGPGRPFVWSEDARHLLIAGDESALPAIATILEALPASMRADVYIEVLNEAEEQPLTTEADVTVHWLHREGGGFDIPGQLLERAVLAAELPDDLGGVWVACEAMIMRNIRRYLLYERDIPRERLVTRGYWKAGVQNHPDHDMGEDV